jgi:hypothetical protein
MSAPPDEDSAARALGATRPREGWAEASKAIAKGGNDAIVWPEFGNTDDGLLVW